MGKTITDKTLALAGVFQNAALVAQAARQGGVEHVHMEAAVRSLFVRNPGATLDVYGDLGALRLGLRTLVQQLEATEGERDLEITRYVVSLLHLERKLAKRKDLLNTIADGLDEAERQLNHFHITHDNVIAKLADVYVNTVSTLQPRIMVSGEHGHLQNPDNANRVRALLLSGIRSAVLWNQCGGTRSQLLFRRKALLTEARRLLANRKVDV